MKMLGGSPHYNLAGTVALAQKLRLLLLLRASCNKAGDQKTLAEFAQKNYKEDFDQRYIRIDKACIFIQKLEQVGNAK